jgi:2-dehydropantoate 2-reductase
VRIVVFGSGGVGGYFGGRLARSGEEVIFIARGEHLQALQTRGLRVESVNGDFRLRLVQSTDNPHEIGIADVILVAVKAWQLPDAALAMKPMVGADTIVIPLQNGIEAPKLLAQSLGAGHVMGGLCRISSFIAAPGVIRHVGIEPYVAFGELDYQVSECSQSLLAAFHKAGVKAEIPADIHGAMWEKFAFISAISGVGGVARAPVGVTRSLLETRTLLRSAIEETFTTAKAHQVGLPGDFITKILSFIDNLPADTVPSLQRDLVAGRPSELSAQIGAIVRLGRERDVLTPVNEFIYNCLLPLELRARGEIEF